MGRISVLLCLVLLVTIGVMVSVSFAEYNEVASTDLKKAREGESNDQSISKVNDNDHDNDHDDDDHNNDHDHDHDNDDHDDDQHHDNDDDDNHDNDRDGDDDNDDDHDHDNDKDGDDDDNDDGDDEDDEKETLDLEECELKKGDLTVKFTDRGASIMSLIFPDKNGKMEDIVLGYDSVDDYMNDTVFFGATVGRVANRREKTVANVGKSKINGGTKGFGDVIWTVTKYSHNGKKPYIVFTHTSLAGDQGKLEVTVTYKLVGENKLKCVMEATAIEKATPINLVHHSYWNLGGHNNGDILSEKIQILGSGYAHVDDNLILIGKILAVKGTPYDFLQLRPIKDNINELKTRKVVVLVDKKSKRKMELSTDQSSLKFYTGGNLKTTKGKNGSVYKGLCLETQSIPNAINYQHLTSQIVEPGKKYKHTMLFKFSIVP